jgi:two-component system, response regulator PdtaR
MKMLRVPVTETRWSNFTVLLAEDEALIAMDIEARLQAFGLKVLGPAATVAAATNLVDQNRPDAALLDVNLRGELITPIVVKLQASRVPLVLMSAYEEFHLPKELHGIPNLSKPLFTQKLWRALNAMLPAA